MSDTIEITAGSCIEGQATWKDDAGTPINLTARTLTITDAYPPALASATHTVVNAAAGVSEFSISTGVAASLYSGRRNWFRLAISDGTHQQVTPKIWIDVQ